MKQALEFLSFSFAARDLFSAFGIALVEGDNLVSVAGFAIRSCMLIASLIQRLQKIGRNSTAEKDSAPAPGPSSAQQ